MNSKSIKAFLCEEISSLAEKVEREVMESPDGEVDYLEGKLNECLIIYRELFPSEDISTSLWDKVRHAWNLAEKWHSK